MDRSASSQRSDIRPAGFEEQSQAFVAKAPLSKIWLSSPHMSGRELQLITEAFQSNYVAPLGPMVDKFEKDLAQLTGFKHVAALTSGTAAMHLALRLVGVERGDEIWGSTLTFIGGVAPIMYEGAVPVFFDSDATGLVDLDLVEEELARARKQNRVPKVLVVTDLYGNVVDMKRARKLCDEYGVKLIADSAESVGSTRYGHAGGHGADFAVYSFNGNKIITTSGGGALASDDGKAIERSRFLATQARDAAPHYQHSTYGYNYRMSNICAAIGVGQLEVLADRVKARRAIHDRYAETLANVPGVHLLPEPADGVANRWLTVMFLDKSARATPPDVMKTLAAREIECRPVWKPMHMQPIFAGTRMVGGRVSERMFAEGVCLPSGSNMTEADMARCFTALRGVLA